MGVEHKDFPFASFQVTLSNIQKKALSVANCRVPCPAEQLALLKSKKQKKTDKSKLSFTNVATQTCMTLMNAAHNTLPNRSKEI